MVFDTVEGALEWFTKDERVLTPDFVANIPWDKVKDTPLDPSFVPVITYMRDIESFTEQYYKELLASPTAKDPHIRAFMDRWVTEEPLHGALLNRFMEEAGVQAAKGWDKDILRHIPLTYRINDKLIAMATRGFGKHFSAVHMAWGATNEQSTLIGYTRLWQKAKHPVLEHILRAICREEAKHAAFYWNVARLRMLNSPFRQKLSRFVMEHFWSPVGEGARPKADADMVTRALFSGTEGLAAAKTLINERISQLPGFTGFTRVHERFSEAMH
jgi:hypothetical protein